MDPGREVERLLELLSEKVLLYAKSTRAVSLAAGWERDYLSQILRDNVALKASHLYTVLAELKVEPERFFAELHPPMRPESRLLHLLREVAAREDQAGLWTEEGVGKGGQPQEIDDRGASVRPQVDRLARLLRRALRAQGLSLAQASERMRRPKRYLSRLLAGEPDLPLLKVYAALAAGGVEPADFFGALHPTGGTGNGGEGGGPEEDVQPLTRQELREEVLRAVRQALAERPRPEDSAR